MIWSYRKCSSKACGCGSSIFANRGTESRSIQTCCTPNLNASRFSGDQPANQSTRSWTDMRCSWLLFTSSVGQSGWRPPSLIGPGHWHVVSSGLTIGGILKSSFNTSTTGAGSGAAFLLSRPSLESCRQAWISGPPTSKESAQIHRININRQRHIFRQDQGRQELGQSMTQRAHSHDPEHRLVTVKGFGA